LKKFSFPELQAIFYDTTEEIGNCVDFAESIGDAMTFIVLAPRDTHKIIYCSNVQSAKQTNLQIPTDGEIDKSNSLDKCPLQSKVDNFVEMVSCKLPDFTPSTLIEIEFLYLEPADSSQHKATIIKVIAEHLNDLENHPTQSKSLIQSCTDNYETISTYSEIVDFLNQEYIDNNHLSDSPECFNFKVIITHTGLLRPTDTNYKGSSCNLLIEWDDGDTTHEP
jgi:hypothetical protein